MKRRDDPFQEIERVFDNLAEFGVQTGGDIAVDVVDEGDALVVVADLPGYETDDIDVELHDDRRLHISAEREEQHAYEEGTVVRRERRSESTSRTVTLPEAVVPEETEAGYENGVLKVRLGKETGGADGTDIPVN